MCKKCPYSEILGLHFPSFGLNTGKHEPEYLRIRTLFAQWVMQLKCISEKQTPFNNIAKSITHGGVFQVL